MKDNIFYKQLSHKLLRTFYVVAQEESITQAAERLFITQPTVTLQIQSLERELGHKLFERNGPAIRLTHAGHKFYELVQPIIVQMETLKSSFEGSLEDMEHGEVRIAAGYTSAMYILPPFIQQFKELHPNIRVKVRHVYGKDLINLVKKDKVDIALGPLSELPNGIEYQPFIEYPTSLITAEGHPLTKRKKITLQEISRYPFVMPPRNLSIWHVLESVFNEHGVHYHVGIETGGWQTVKRYVEFDLGVSIINNANIIGGEALTLTDVSQYFPSRTYGLIGRRGKFYSPQSQAFIHLFNNGEQFLQDSQAES